MNPWRVYVMIADPGGDLRHIKIGISSSLLKRIGAVQTGCPMEIEMVLAVAMPEQACAVGAEREIHAALAEYRTSGEWFLLDTTNETHAEAFRDATRSAIGKWLGSDWKWEVADMAALRRWFRSPDGYATARRRTTLSHAYRMAKGLPMW